MNCVDIDRPKWWFKVEDSALVLALTWLAELNGKNMPLNFPAGPSYFTAGLS